MPGGLRRIGLRLKKYGVARILLELGRRGVDRDTARLALEPIAPEDPAEADCCAAANKIFP